MKFSKFFSINFYRQYFLRIDYENFTRKYLIFFLTIQSNPIYEILTFMKRKKKYVKEYFQNGSVMCVRLLKNFIIFFEFVTKPS